MTFLFRRGKGAPRRKVHLCGYDPRTGQPTMVPLCGINYPFNMTSIGSWGRPICTRCKQKAATS